VDQQAINMNKSSLQPQIEAALTKLSQEFLEEPYRFYTEADAVSRCRQLLELNDELGRDYKTKDDHKVKLIHQEYPTFIRYERKTPSVATPTGRRGHYDLVILNPDFIKDNNAETITNHLLEHMAPEPKGTIDVVIEFKLNSRGWSRGAYINALIDLQKLAASPTDLAYAVMLMRYAAPSMRRWEIYWPKICEEVKKPNVGSVRSIYTVHWLSTQTKEPNTYFFGPWLLSETEQSHNQ
jgi:hypothetical protein